MPTMKRAVHIWAFCVPTSLWESLVNCLYVFGNRVAGSGLYRVYQGERERDHTTSE